MKGESISRLPLFVAASLLFVSCSSMSLGTSSDKNIQMASLTMAELQQKEDHLIAPEDELEVVVWGVREFEAHALQSGDGAGVRQAGYRYRVHADGSIDLPLIGNTPVGGMTVQQAKEAVAAAMRRYVDEPKVGVTVTSYNSRKILVLGEVKKPGIVQDPGPNLALAEALAKAGGVDLITASGSNVYIIRGALTEPKVIRVEIDTAMGMFQAQHIWLRSRDVVFVDSRVITDWNRFISQILPTVTNAFLVQRMTQ